MPRFLLPERSTPHRVAAIALYRALLTRCTSAPLSDEHRNSLRHAIQQKFRKNAKIQSPRQLGLSFRAGYETLDQLDAARTDNDNNTKLLTKLIHALPSRLKNPLRPRSTQLSPKELSENLLVCLPNDKAVLNVRPYHKVSGPRHVPILCSANGVPFLRLQKPQPSSLSRMLRFKIDQRQKVFDQRVLLVNYWLPLARQEDEWDDILERESGTQSKSEDERSWASEIHHAIGENARVYEKRIAADKQIARTMQNIVDQETALALREGVKVIRGRKGRLNAKVNIKQA